IAILRDESEAMSCAQAISDAMTRRVSAVNFVESAAVIDASRDPIATRRVDDFIREANISIEPVTEVQAQIARAAYRDFGKGSGHPARLNFGDCFAYALAKNLVNLCYSKVVISVTPTSSLLYPYFASRTIGPARPR